MTVQCAWCKKIIGEKCSACGPTQLEVAAIALTTPQGTIPLFMQVKGADCPTFAIAAVYTCKPCDRTWYAGQEKISHAMCEECQTKAMAKDAKN